MASTSHLDHVATLKFWTKINLKDGFKDTFKAALPHLWASLEADGVETKPKVWCISRIADHLELAHSISRAEQARQLRNRRTCSDLFFQISIFFSDFDFFGRSH